MVGEDRPYREWLRTGFQRPRATRKGKSSSPPRQNREETVEHPTKEPPTKELLTETHFSMLGDTCSNPETMEIVTIMGKQFPRIKDVGDGLTSTPFPSGSVHVGQVTMMQTETSEIERNPETQGHNLINMPTMHEEENVKKYNALDEFDALTNLEAHAPPHESTQTTKAKDHIWKKVIRKDKITGERNGPVITIVGKKRRQDERKDADGKKKTKG